MSWRAPFPKTQWGSNVRESHPPPTPVQLTCMFQLESQARPRAQSKAHLVAALVLGHDHTPVPTFFTSLSPPMSLNQKSVLPLPWCNTVLKRHFSRRGLHVPVCLASTVSHRLVLIQGRWAEVTGHFLVGVCTKQLGLLPSPGLYLPVQCKELQGPGGGWSPRERKPGSPNHTWSKAVNQRVTTRLDSAVRLNHWNWGVICYSS